MADLMRGEAQALGGRAMEGLDSDGDPAASPNALLDVPRLVINSKLILTNQG